MENSASESPERIAQQEEEESGAAAMEEDGFEPAPPVVLVAEYNNGLLGTAGGTGFFYKREISVD